MFLSTESEYNFKDDTFNFMQITKRDVEDDKITI